MTRDGALVKVSYNFCDGFKKNVLFKRFCVLKKSIKNGEVFLIGNQQKLASFYFRMISTISLN